MTIDVETLQRTVLPYESRAPHAPWWERHDPFWADLLWDTAPTLRSFAYAEQVVDNLGVRRIVERPRWYTDRPAQRALTSAASAPTKRRLMSNLIGFHHADTFQLCAAAGLYRPSSSTYLKPLYESGLVRRGEYQVPASMRLGKLPYIYAPERAGTPLDRWAAQLDPADATAIIGRDDGRLLRAEPHVRHNMLALEAGLRLAECNPTVAALWPEAFASPRRLIGDPAAPADHEADLVIERDDGLRVAIELVASGDISHLTRKIDRWAAVLARYRYAQVGLIVVLLNARSLSHRRLTTRLRLLIDQRVTVGQVRHPNGMAATPAEVASAATMLHVASWADWFPAAGTIAEAGRQMLTQVRSRTGQWRPAILADSTHTPMPTAAHAPATPPLLAARPAWIGGPVVSGAVA